MPHMSFAPKSRSTLNTQYYEIFNIKMRGIVMKWQISQNLHIQMKAVFADLYSLTMCANVNVREHV